MAINSFLSSTYVFNVDDITVTFSGDTLADVPQNLDTTESVVPAFIDKDDDVLYAVDSEFGFDVTDFIGATQKELDGDFAEGFAGNIIQLDENQQETVVGLALRNSPTDIFLSGLPLGTWAYGLGGQTVKASTEHYATMVDVLSDQKYPNDPDALGPLDNDLRLLDLEQTGAGTYEPGILHDKYVTELSEALQRAIDNTDAGTNPQVYDDVDFDRDGTNDTFTTLSVTVDYDTDGDGVPESIQVGGVDLDDDDIADIIDRPLNGIGGTADIVDLLEPNEASVTQDIAYSTDYSVTLKDDGKLLYRFGSAVKKPNDLRLDTKIELPEEWLVDEDDNGIADILEQGSTGIVVTKAELVISHDITNNPNDQVRPEDYENEAAIGRLPSYYIVVDPDDPTNTLWVSLRDSFNGEGEALPSYFQLTDTGEIDLNVVGGIEVRDPNGVLVGYRNTDATGSPIGTVFKSENQAALNDAADLDFESEDLAEGFTAAWYTSVDREPFEWSYDKFPDDPFKQDFISFRSADEAAAAGYTEDSLVSGPRWRLTPNKFGQDLPGLEVPLTENTSPPYQKDNIKYETGEFTTTTLNLLDWEGASPLTDPTGWMLIDPTRMDENGDGLIDEGWSAVNGTLGAGDALPTGLITEAVTPNGMTLTPDFLDTAVYVKGDRQDSAKLYDMQLEIEYIDNVIGTVQQVSNLDHRAQTITFEQGAMFDDAVVFVTPPTFNGTHAATIAVENVTATGATISVDEPDYLDGWHTFEDVSMVTFSEGNFTMDDGSRIEVGTIEIPAGALETATAITFDQAFDEAPTILIQLQTQNGPNWVTVRADNVSTTGFDVLLQEQEDNDNWHTSEILGWAAIESGGASDLIDFGDVTAQAFAVADAVNDKGFEFTFDSSLGLDPLVAADISSFIGTDTAFLRLEDITNDGFAATAEFLVQEEQSLDEETGHILEDISGLAFDSAGLLQGTKTPDADEFAFI